MSEFKVLGKASTYKAPVMVKVTSDIKERSERQDITMESSRYNDATYFKIIAEKLELSGYSTGKWLITEVFSQVWLRRKETTAARQRRPGYILHWQDIILHECSM